MHESIAARAFDEVVAARNRLLTVGAELAEVVLALKIDVNPEQLSEFRLNEKEVRDAEDRLANLIENNLFVEGNTPLAPRKDM